MAKIKFYDERSEASLRKITIVLKYFDAWANVMLRKKPPAESIVFLDLFCGPGVYEDGSHSTPVLLLKRALKMDDVRSSLRGIFNDKDSNFIDTLRRNVQEISNIGTLGHSPQYHNQEVDKSILERIGALPNVPILFFLDPWGYKGLSLELVNSVLARPFCDCIFFLNYNRVNMALNNQTLEECMDDLFGKRRANELRSAIDMAASPTEREEIIITAIATELRKVGGEHFLNFCFKRDHSTMTSHYIIFASKHIRGFEIMQNIMAGVSSIDEQGVASFSHDPMAERTPTLFPMDQPLDELKEYFCRVLAGKRITVRRIYEEHRLDQRFTEKNYKEALRQLEEEARIVVDPPAHDRIWRKGVVTMPNDVLICFPLEGSQQRGGQ